VPGQVLPSPPAGRNLLSAVRVAVQRIASARNLEGLFDCTLGCLAEDFDIEHASILLLDAAHERLRTVASMGYAHSGVGSEIPLGEGVVGIAARERTPIRIGHATAEYAYGRAIREAAEKGGLAGCAEIPPPGLKDARSQIAVPIEAFGELVGALFADSPKDLRFGYDDEDALVALAGHLGAAIRMVRGPAA
jgi:adenylate cyclase